tara:strand:- start:1747 stop:2199 length:453 start_codon:yes stop_codon:yes gene_type:complete
MTKAEFKERIKGLAFEVIKDRKKSEIAAVEYDELTKFPELKKVIIDLLTPDFDAFLSGIDWIAPRPTTFRIKLQNNESFYLIWMDRSWIAQIEGKKYYLLNLPEEERAAEAIARILRYGTPDSSETAVDVDTSGGEEIGAEVDDTVDVET